MECGKTSANRLLKGCFITVWLNYPLRSIMQSGPLLICSVWCCEVIEKNHTIRIWPPEGQSRFKTPPRIRTTLLSTWYVITTYIARIMILCIIVLSKICLCIKSKSTSKYITHYASWEHSWKITHTEGTKEKLSKYRLKHWEGIWIFVK